MLNITASSGEFYQGDCESLILPHRRRGVRRSGRAQPGIGGSAHGNCEVHRERRDPRGAGGRRHRRSYPPPSFCCWWTAPSARRTSTATVPRPLASARKSACSISRVCTNTTRARSPLTAPCSVCRPRLSISGKLYLNQILSKESLHLVLYALGWRFFCGYKNLCGSLLAQGRDLIQRETGVLCNFVMGHFICKHTQCNSHSFGMCCFTSSFISHFFHSSAHICHSFRILFEIAYTIGQCRIIHFRCIGAEKNRASTSPKRSRL